jgi:hypothetical protein
MKKKVADLKLNPNNPRFIRDDKFEKLKKSITGFPEMLEARPIIVDENNIILGGNMRYRAVKELGWKEVEVKVLTGLNEKQKKEFVIKDNAAFGEWDWELLANDFDVDEVKEWGIDIPGLEINEDELSDEFAINSGDKSPFQQITFTLADKQATAVKKLLEEIKKLPEFEKVENYGNENGNGNALYYIIKQWKKIAK